MKAYILRNVPDQLWRQVKAIAALDQNTLETTITAALAEYVAQRYRTDKTEERTGTAE